MKIAILAPLVTPIVPAQVGGAQSVVADIASGLAARGHEVDLFVASGSSIPGLSLIDTGVDSETLTADLFKPGSGRRSGSNALRAAYEHAYSLVAKGGYDIVHNHGFDGPAIQMAQKIPFRVVHTLHLPPDPGVAEALSDASGWENPPAVAVVSQSQAELWEPFVKITAVLRNGVPVQQIPWSGQSAGSLLFAGRLSPEKGALHAIAIAVQAGLALTVMGHPYDPDYAAEVEATARRESLVTLEPPATRRDLWNRLTTSRALLCPVCWDEPFGMVAAEAQACGCPVIAYRRGGLSEVVRHGITGALVSPGDVAGAAEAASAATNLSREQCRRHAETELNLKDTLDAHERLYRSSLATGASKG